jgi:hypothetical protein
LLIVARLAWRLKSIVRLTWNQAAGRLDFAARDLDFPQR